MTDSLVRDYLVRESLRAKRVRLVMSLWEGLIVVVPHGFDQARIPPLLEKEERWIARAAEERRRRWSALAPEVATPLPHSICLRYLDEEWRVEYCRPSAAKGRVHVREVGECVLRLSGTSSGDARVDEAAQRAALRRWVARKARGALVPQAAEMARMRGFSVGKVSIRCQRTRWGSCSRDNNLSLNAKLMFLPPSLVSYVLLHELCHTVEPNHSPRFWSLLEAIEPSCKDARRALRSAAEYVPAWMRG